MTENQQKSFSHSRSRSLQRSISFNDTASNGSAFDKSNPLRPNSNIDKKLISGEIKNYSRSCSSKLNNHKIISKSPLRGRNAHYSANKSYNSNRNKLNQKPIEMLNGNVNVKMYRRSQSHTPARQFSRRHRYLSPNRNGRRGVALPRRMWNCAPPPSQYKISPKSRRDTSKIYPAPKFNNGIYNTQIHSPNNTSHTWRNRRMKPLTKRPLSPDVWTHDRFRETSTNENEDTKKKTYINLYAESFDQLYSEKLPSS